ncbi:MAG: hypothetical protein R3272_09175 [Candidatus Promineifilaceae bacterium]|nr:hypothetical protein [Candidatus Promineifilaceae bacterium]
MNSKWKMLARKLTLVLLPLLLSSLVIAACNGDVETTVPEGEINPDFFGAEVVDEAVVEIGAVEGFLIDGDGEIHFVIVRTLTNILVLVEPDRFENRFAEPFDAEAVFFAGSAADLESLPAVEPDLLFDPDPAVEPEDIGLDAGGPTLFVVRET